MSVVVTAAAAAVELLVV